MSSHTRTKIHALFATIVAGALITATVAASNATTTASVVQDITIVASDFKFEAPDTVRAGLTRVRLRNKGPDFHHVQIVRLRDGGSVGELLDTLKATSGKAPAGSRFVGGPNVPANDGSSEAILTLRPGRYALICFVAGTDHIPHMQKGMTRLLTVTPTRETTASRTLTPEPTADARMVLRDYAFDISPVIRAGHRTVRVENAAAQPHEALLARLAPGKTLGDLMEWMGKREGPMPGEQIGGTTAISQGEVNFITVDFTAGEYILICFVRDETDGKSHLAHGMARQFTVEPATRATAAAPTPFAWPGTYDLVGSGFPDGDRMAVMHIAKNDTAYSLMLLQGPPGSLLRFDVAHDSAHVRWNLGNGVMLLDLRGSGDSLTGEWASGELTGPVRGARRR